MSHFSVFCIVGTVPLDEAEERITEMLAPYDENTQVEPYRDYLSPRGIAHELAICDVADEIERRVGPRPDNRAGFEGLRERAKALRRAGVTDDSDPRIVAIDTAWKKLVGEGEAYEERVGAAFTGAEVAAISNAKWAKDDNDDRILVAEDGRPFRMSTYNPKSKWDWFSIGGRWTGLLPLKPTAGAGDYRVGEPGAFGGRAPRGTADIAQAGMVELDGLADRIYALLTPEGWDAPATMGWFGVDRERTEDEAAWRDRVAKTLAALDPRTVIAVVDCHT